ncbi:MAG: hypothetical protein OEM46_00345 [Ignavibacteria bacterium]|nr:hypothetical protein [Ignavibacteria bacterium]
MENDEKKYEDVIKALNSLQEVKAPANFEADLQRRINSEKFSKEEKKGFWENIFLPSKLIPSLGLVAAAVVIFFIVDTNPEEMDNPFLIEPRVREDVFVIAEYEELEQKQEEFSKQKSLKKNEPIREKRRDEDKLKSSERDESTIENIKIEGQRNSLEGKKELGRESGDVVDVLTDDKDLPEDKEIVSGAYAVAESTIVDSLAVPQPTTATVTSSELVTGQIITKEELNFRQVQLTEEEQKTVNELKVHVQSVEKPNKSQK